uniref:Mitochondrial-processing peptidase subunit alpha n=1 Tax=Ascaris suum TaxID=6253 RepID=F1L1J9_ASCSU
MLSRVLCRRFRSVTRLIDSHSTRRWYATYKKDSSSHFATATGHPLKVDAGIDINRIPLTEPIPGLSEVAYAAHIDIEPFDTKLTVLENGMKVASEPHYGQYCTIGVAIDSGSRYEVYYPSGTSHFIEKLAFSATSSFASKEELFSLLEQRGALIDCQSTKDTFIYASSCHISGVKDVLTVIADAVHRPLITPQELEDCRLIVSFENEDMSSKPECEALLTDWIHEAAFNGNTLGFSKYCPPENVNKIQRQHLFSYMKQYHSPDRMVVAGIGVDHDILVDAARELFDASKTTWAKDSSLLLPNEPPLDKSAAQYTGGDKRVVKDLSNMALGPSPFPNLAHVVIGFESCGYRDEDFVAFCVLQSLMGGGGSFSAGGPGKGMYTRLYVDVLNRCHWMYNATAFNHAYADSGLFCIQASSDPSKLYDTVTVIVQQFLRLPSGAAKEELERAKTQLKSQLMMNLEVRPVMFEDLSRQVLGHGYRRKPAEYIRRIDAITSADIVRVVERMLVTPPSVVGYGDLKVLPDYACFDKAFAKRSYLELAPGKSVRL